MRPTVRPDQHLPVSRPLAHWPERVAAEGVEHRVGVAASPRRGRLLGPSRTSPSRRCRAAYTEHHWRRRSRSVAQRVGGLGAVAG